MKKTFAKSLAIILAAMMLHAIYAVSANAAEAEPEPESILLILAGDSETAPQISAFKNSLLTTLQWSWGLPQNLVSGLGHLVLRGQKERYHGAYVTYADIPPLRWTAITMGKFIFVFNDRSDFHLSEDYLHDLLLHEYGHTLQSAALGPLYLVVIGVPSFIWSQIPEAKRGKDYFSFYTETWADAWSTAWLSEELRTR